MNRLLSYNLSKPIGKRVSMPSKEQVYAARMAGNAVALLALVHIEIADKLRAKRASDDLLDRCTEAKHGREKQGYSCLIGDKYNGPEYAQGKETESDLACENEPRFACIVESVRLVEV